MLSASDSALLTFASSFLLNKNKLISAAAQTTNIKIKPFQYLGNKAQVLDFIYPHISEHLIFIDSFGGSGVVTLNKTASKIEVYNDANPILVNFMRVIRDDVSFKDFIGRLPCPPTISDFDTALGKFGKMLVRVEGNPTVRIEEMDILHDDQHEIHEDPLLGQYEYADPVGVAIAYLIVQVMGPFSRGLTFDSTFHEISILKNASSLKNKTKVQARLRQVHLRLADVLILNSSNIGGILNRFDDPDTFFYLDPPYAPVARNGFKGGDYNHETSDRWHTLLIDRLVSGLKGKAILSGYRSELYGKLEDAGWTYHSKMIKAGRLGSRRECIWVSP
jgi:DNA adenine methylase